MEETLAVSDGDVVMWCWFRKKHNNNSYMCGLRKVKILMDSYKIYKIHV